MGSHGARGGATPWTHLKAVNSRKELPSPWSAPRAWDAKQVEPTSQATPQEEEDEEMMLQGEGQDGNEGGLRDEMDVQENLNGVVEDSEDEDAAGQGTADPQDRPYEALGEENAPANVASPSRTGKNAAQARRQRRKAATLPPVATEEDETGGNGPTEGFIAVTSVTKAMTELCQSAVRRLHGLRLCTSKQEERAMTHLVIGEERRTLKLLLAVANGALLMSPEWVTASIEAGHWLPEGPYLADVRFAHAAQRARSTLTSSSSKLLHQHAIYYHANRGGNGAAHVAALKRLAGALGAESAQVMACTVCVAVGEGLKWPAALPKGVPMVSEEWLLQAAEQFKVPSTKQFLLK